MWATKMFDSSAQREFIDGLHLWLETRGIALLFGPAGVGKSITLRRFKEELDDRRFDLFYLFNLRVTPTGSFSVNMKKETENTLLSSLMMGTASQTAYWNFCACWPIFLWTQRTVSPSYSPVRKNSHCA
jgi:hypothetical protein